MITLERSPDTRQGTYWRPIKHTVTERRAIEILRREATEGSKRKVDIRFEETEYSAVNMLLAGANKSHSEAQIEDPYKRGEFIRGFVYVRSIAAFVHESMVDRFENMSKQIGAGAIIGKAVRIEDNVTVEPFAELEAGAYLGNGSRVGENAVIRKGTVLGKNAEVGANAYVGQFSSVGRGATIAGLATLQRHVTMQPNSSIGIQSTLDHQCFLGPDAWLDDSVHIGEGTFIGRGTQVGEMTKIGHHTHLGNGALIGAESDIGNLVRVSPNVWLVSPTYTENGEHIAVSNFLPTKE